jgi:penicillin amidase
MEEPSDEPGAALRLAQAKTVADAKAALATWVVPIQNWLLADDRGQIGYYPAGLVPKRKGWDGTHPVPGWTGEFEWDGFIPPEQLPQLWDPPSGLIVTANNKVVPPGDYPWPYTLDAAPGYRAERIREVLLSKGKVDAEEMRRLQVDVHVKQADRLLPSLLSAIKGLPLKGQEAQARVALQGWDRVASVDSVGASVFFATYREAWELALKDDLSPELYRLVCSFPYASGFFDRLWADRPSSRFFDVRGTPAVEDRDEVLRQAFSRAVKNLALAYGPDAAAWRWGRLHTLTFGHAFGERDELKGTFNVGPVEIPGAHNTVWEAGWVPWDAAYTFTVKHGPAFRHVIDLGDPGAGGMVVDLGQSGHAGTARYANGLPDWKAGRLWRLSMDAAEYAKGAAGTLTLEPPPGR